MEKDDFDRSTPMVIVAMETSPPEYRWWKTIMAFEAERLSVGRAVVRRAGVSFLLGQADLRGEVICEPITVGRRPPTTALGCSSLFPESYEKTEDIET